MRLALFAALALALLSAPPVRAQAFGALQQDARLQIPSAPALGMGDAVTALPSAESAFLTNPAGLARMGPRVRFTLAGVAVGAGGNLRETYAFVRDDLQPAFEEGVTEVRRQDPERYQALYAEALRIGASPKAGFAAAYGPAVQLRAGGLALGAGIVGHTVTRGRLFDGGGGFPYVDLYAQADVAVPVSAALVLPGAPFGLAVGAQATFAERRVTAKADPLDALDPDSEKLYVLRGRAASLDVGLQAQDVGLPGLDLGVAVQNVAGGQFDLAFDRSFAFVGEDSAPDDRAEIAALEARFAGREARPLVRVGAAYRLPVVPGLPLRGMIVSADYVGASTSEYHQGGTAGLRAGARALAGPVELRAGLSQGYPSAGAGLRLPGVRLDYAFFGVEEGRVPGQLGRQNHLVQIRLGRF